MKEGIKNKGITNKLVKRDAMKEFVMRKEE